jgi:hypothetical protein
MRHGERFAADAALTLQAQRESIADVRSSIAAVLTAGDALDGRASAETFKAAWYLARGVEFAPGTPAELLVRHDELLGELDAQLWTLEKEVRDHAMMALGSGDMISDSDLDALLSNG